MRFMSLINRMVIYACCLCAMIYSGVTVKTVISALLIITVMFLGVYFTDKMKNCILTACFIALSFKVPEFGFGLPVFVYEDMELFWMVHKNKNRDISVGVLSAVAVCAGFVNMFFIYDMAYCIIMVVLSVFAIMVNVFFHLYSNVKRQLITLRDDSTELNNALKERYKYLREKQDRDINIATLKERNRIAREIHDNVGHMLSRSILQVGAVMAVCKDEMTSEMLKSVKQTLDTAMNNIRSSVHDLRDESINLNQAVKDIISEMKNYEVHYEYDIVNDVPKQLKYCIITIIKEAASNVVKHSDADTIDIIVREHPAFYQLFFKDNGKCVHDGDGTGMGIDNMKERVESFGGNINISNDDGFRIFINIPKVMSV